MYSNYDRNPAWYRDAKWLSGVLLLPVVALGLLFFSLATLTSENMAKPVLSSLLRLTLLPEGNEQAEQIVEVQPGLDFEPGGPLRLVPGVEVFAEPTELDGLTAAAARERIATLLTDATLTEGREGVLARVSNPGLQRQLTAAFDTTLPLIAASLLETSMLPAGLDNGTRLADWRLQALQKPGEEVQPIVGIFVTTTPEAVGAMTNRQIGEFVVRSLAEITLNEGLAAAQERVPNANLRSRLTETVQNGVRQNLTSFFATLLVSSEAEIDARLAQARELLVAQAAADDAENRFQSLAGVNTQGLSPEEANRAVLTNLADVAYARGSTEVISLVSDVQQVERLRAAQGAIDTFTRASHARFLRLTWILGVVAALLVAALLIFSAGFTRVLNLGIVLSIAALGGSLLAWWFYSTLEASPVAAPPLSLGTAGVVGYLNGLLSYLGSSLPIEAFWLVLRNHIVVLGAGLALIVVYLVLQILQAFRPRRRTLL